MPFYDYVCDGCKARIERNQAMSDPPLRDCPECGAPKLRKLFTTAGVLGTSSGGGGDFTPPSCPTGGGCSSGMCGMG